MRAVPLSRWLAVLVLAGCATGTAPTEDTDTAVCGGPEDCPTSTLCLAWTCAEAACVSAPQNLDAAIAEQVDGDCRVLVCGTDGAPFPKPDAADVPESSTCVAWACGPDGPVRTDADLGEACDGGVCDGAGGCATCLTETARDACGVACEALRLCAGEPCDAPEACASGSCPEGTCG